MSNRRATPEDRARAAQLREMGYSYLRIAKMIGYTHLTVRAWFSEKAKHDQRRKYDEMRAYRACVPRDLVHKVRTDADAAKQIVPKDTRDLTARFCGDPLPGRSALDRRQHQ